MNLPTKSYDWYIGIDPGFKGGIVLLSEDGRDLTSWSMPVLEKPHELDLQELDVIADYLYLRMNGKYTLCAGMENSTTRPGEGAERSARFGRQLGVLDAWLRWQVKVDSFRIAPKLWKGRLGLPGKDHPNANATCAAVWDKLYPQHTGFYRGPKGGIYDGLLDAALIAHFLRVSASPIKKGDILDCMARFGKKRPTPNFGKDLTD